MRKSAGNEDTVLTGQPDPVRKHQGFATAFGVHRTDPRPPTPYQGVAGRSAIKLVHLLIDAFSSSRVPSMSSRPPAGEKRLIACCTRMCARRSQNSANSRAVEYSERTDPRGNAAMHPGMLPSHPRKHSGRPPRPPVGHLCSVEQVLCTWCFPQRRTGEHAQRAWSRRVHR